MTKLGDLFGDKSDLLARAAVEVGDVHLLPFTQQEGITPKDGEGYRNKFLVVLGFDSAGNAIGGVVINSKINRNLPSSVTDYWMPISVKDCPFLDHDSFVNCAHLLVVKKEKITSKTYRGKIEDESLMGLIVGTIVDSPHVNKQQLKEFGILKD